MQGSVGINEDVYFLDPKSPELTCKNAWLQKQKPLTKVTWLCDDGVGRVWTRMD